jgi:glyoxylase-like metal-dependent hydrolase (beta-lactamase superfamily II)
VSSGAACDRLLCLTLGWEYAPESVSLEGGTRTFLKLPLIGILARSPAGWVLLETGCDPRPYRGVSSDPLYGEHLPEFDTDGDPLLEGMAAHGLEPGDLTAAAVSHLHVDHSGGLRHLAAAGVEVAIQGRELEFGRERAGAPEFYRDEDYMLDGLGWRELDGEAEIAPGIEAIPTPGHTPGHMSYRVRMRESGTWLFAVDAIDLQQGIDEDRAIGWSADPAEAPLRRASHDRLVELAGAEGARLVPGHCPVAWPPLCTAEGFR